MNGMFEALESRQLLAVFTVSNLDNAGAGSLRKAITDANALPGADTIEFDGALSGNITLASQLDIFDALTINGRAGIGVDGDNACRVFNLGSLLPVAIKDLTITNGSASKGAGIYSEAPLTLTRVTITRCIAGGALNGEGGGIRNDGTLTLLQCTLSGNSATGAFSGEGGGVYSEGTLTIVDTTIHNNSASTLGGGVYTDGDAEITSSTFSDNAASADGGAIVAVFGDLLILNSTLSGNSAGGDGGSIRVDADCDTTIHNSTIAANNATGSGDGIFIETGASLLMTSTIVSGNGTEDIIGTLASGSISNLVADTTENGGLVDGTDGNLVGVDPLLSPLDDNGGLTETHALLEGSPAIDAGANESGDASADQRGGVFARIGTPDIGAYERQALALIVDSLGDTEDGDVSAGNLTLREAVAATSGNPGADTITFASSLAGQTILRDPSESSLTILGEVDIDGPESDRITLDGNRLGSVFTVSETGTLRISGLTITNGETTTVGGGISSEGALEIENCVITGNTADWGGGIYQDSGSLSIANSTISENTSVARGGGILATECELTMIDCVVQSNESESGGGVYLDTVAAASITGCTFTGNTARDNGGGLCATESTVQIESNTFSSNGSGFFGGGIFLDTLASLLIQGSTLSSNAAGIGGGIATSTGGGLTIEECSISDNQAEIAAGGLYIAAVTSAAIISSTLSGNVALIDGGGLLALDSSISVSDSVITGNTSSRHGGGIYAQRASLSFSLSTISENAATNNGGAFYLLDSTLALGSSLVSANTAEDGGGIWAATDPVITITSSTLSGNSATRLGGALTFESGYVTLTSCTIFNNAAPDTGGVFNDFGTMTAISTIIASNTGGDVGELNATPELDAFASGSINNLIGDSSTAGGLVDVLAGNVVGADPLLGPLANNGGPTLTHRVLTGSPAINAGANPHSLTTDQRGFQRVRGTTIDIGAVEFIGGPSIASFSAPSSSLAQGLSTLLTAAGVTDPDGSVSGVRFYLDVDGDSIADTDELLFNDTNTADGFTYLYESDSDDTLGDRRFLAVGYDEDGTTGSSFVLTLALTEPVSIGSPNGTTDSSNIHQIATVNTVGHVLVYLEGWTYEDLTEKTGAPVATSPAITWVDPKNGLSFVAATSASGLVLFTRSAPGAWSFRNLSTETGATDSPAGNLTHFISKRQKIVVIAGTTESGRVVAFRQSLTATSPGVHEFSFIDISADLESQGQSTPDLTGLISYIPDWDTWHLAGVDSMGRIQSIWINTNNPAFTKWRTDDLSAITGAPAISGQLAVTLTSWGGINLTGLDSAGNMLTTWWIPRFAGHWAINNLTSLYNGPQLVGGNLTAYTTSWGGINYVGLDGAGDVRVYWWVPSFGGTWAISNLIPSSTPDENIPAGRLTSHASASGTLNVFGTSDTGDLLRLVWKPGTAWSIEDLTEIAVEA